LTKYAYKIEIKKNGTIIETKQENSSLDGITVYMQSGRITVTNLSQKIFVAEWGHDKEKISYYYNKGNIFYNYFLSPDKKDLRLTSEIDDIYTKNFTFKKK
jgi:hypothetical protein